MKYNFAIGQSRFFDSKLWNGDEVMKGSVECYFVGRVEIVRSSCCALQGVHSTQRGDW